MFSFRKRDEIKIPVAHKKFSNTDTENYNIFRPVYDTSENKTAGAMMA